MITTRPKDSQQKKKKKKKKKRQRERNCRIVDFVVLADHQVKLKESEKRDKYQDLARKLKKKKKKKKNLEHESDGDTSCDLHTRYSYERVRTGNGGLGN